MAKGKPKGRGRGAEPKAKAKAKAKAGGTSRVQFPDRLCRDIAAGRECSRGKACKCSHDLKHFDENGKP